MDFNLGKLGDSRGFSSLGLDRVSGMQNTDDHGKGDDVLGKLPEDPFCMNMKSTFKAAIADWLHENQTDLGSDSNRSRESDKPIGGDQTVFKSLNWVHNGTVMMFQQETGSIKINDMFMPCCSSHDYGADDPSIDCDSVSDGEKASSVVHGGGEPHDAFAFVLSYLRLQDLLAVEGVCRSLRDAVRRDPFLWKTIRIDFPLSERVTDDSLLKLTRKAQGNLQCFSLLGCLEITDYGLMRVLRSNPRLEKLSVSGCLRLSAKGMLSNFRVLKSSGILGLKSLRTGGAFCFTIEQFKELNMLLGVDDNARLKLKTPRFYGVNQSQISFEDDRVIDLEICPRCEKPGLVYDCPATTCQGKDQSSPWSSCRACIICIERCFCCGCCINDCEFEEMFCLAFSCLVCSEQMLRQREKVETKATASSSSSSSPRIPQEMRYQFCFYG